jgi:hypothetical protein
MAILLFRAFFSFFRVRFSVKKGGEWGKIGWFFPRHRGLTAGNQQVVVLEGWGLCTWLVCSGVPSLLVSGAPSFSVCGVSFRRQIFGARLDQARHFCTEKS